MKFLRAFMLVFLITLCSAAVVAFMHVSRSDRIGDTRLNDSLASDGVSDESILSADETQRRSAIPREYGEAPDMSNSVASTYGIMSLSASDVTLTVNKDGAPWVVHGRIFTLRQGGVTVPGTGNNDTIIFTGVADDTYSIFDGETNTGETVTVAGGNEYVSLNYFTVTYDGNSSDGGTVPTDSDSPYLEGTEVTVLNVGNLEKTNHSFDGWNTAANGVGNPYTAGDKFYIDTKTTLYAQWTINPPTISIDTQPQAATNVTAGSITGSLTVAASVVPSATPAFQWFRNTTNNNTGGSLLPGATSDSLTIPTALTIGTHYFYVVVSYGSATPVTSNVAQVIVAAPPPGFNVTINNNESPGIAGQRRTITISPTGGASTSGTFLLVQITENVRGSRPSITAIQLRNPLVNAADVVTISYQRPGASISVWLFDSLVDLDLTGSTLPPILGHDSTG